MTRGLFKLLMCSLLFAGCNRQSSVENKAALPSLPVVAIEDIPAPKIQKVMIGRGQNLRLIGSAAYGHERFSGFVAVLNRIPDPERIGEGVELKTPSLGVAFRDAEMDQAYQPVLNVLAKACTDYFSIEPAYLAARQASGVQRGNFSIPADIQAKLVACADAIDAAVARLSAVKPPHGVPKLAIGQFRQAAKQIRELARGSIDGDGYDYDMVGQRFGLAFTNALIWTQQGHR